MRSDEERGQRRGFMRTKEVGHMASNTQTHIAHTDILRTAQVRSGRPFPPWKSPQKSGGLRKQCSPGHAKFSIGSRGTLPVKGHRSKPETISCHRCRSRPTAGIQYPMEFLHRRLHQRARWKIELFWTSHMDVDDVANEPQWFLMRVHLQTSAVFGEF